MAAWFFKVKGVRMLVIALCVCWALSPVICLSALMHATCVSMPQCFNLAVAALAGENRYLKPGSPYALTTFLKILTKRS